MAEIRIRKATADDVPLILSLIRELARYEKLEAEVVATEHGLRETLFPAERPVGGEVGAAGSRGVAEVLVAEHRGRPAGFALFFHNYSTFLGRPGIYLEDLYVRPESRGVGIGGALMARIAELAVERGCGRLEWWVLNWNEPAIRFYERLGAEAMSDWTVYRLTGPALPQLARKGVRNLFSGESPQEPPSSRKGS